VEGPYIFVGLNTKVTEVILNQNFYQLSIKNNSCCLEEINILETSLNLYMLSDTKQFNCEFVIVDFQAIHYF
jgi:hypothetical protein